MNPAVLTIICIYNSDWNNGDTHEIETGASKEFIEEISARIVARTSWSLCPDDSMMRVKVKNAVEKCDQLKDKTHASYCKESSDQYEYRVYIEATDPCVKIWESEISTPSYKNPQVLGKLLQHVFIIYLGIRTHEYVDYEHMLQ